MNFIDQQQKEAHLVGLTKSKNAKECDELTVLPLGYLSGITKQTIINTLNHILNSGMLEEKPVNICGYNFKGATVDTKDAVEIIRAFEKRGHNEATKAIREFITKIK